MSDIDFFDIETSGMPNWKIQSEDPSQPHMVQLAALRVDEETKEVKQSMDVIIRPEGWVIEQDTIDIHGITQEHAMDVGIPEKEALQMFLAMHDGCSKRVAYNTTFDNRIIRIAIKRYLGDKVADEFKCQPYECAMQLARKVKGAKKPYKLEEAYEIFTGKTMEDAHNAMADTQACMDVYFAAKKQQAESA